MSFFTLSDKGLVRPNNEDFVEGLQINWCGPFGNIQSLTALFLADGMGGAAAGEYASMLAVRTVRSRLLNGILNRPYEELLSTDMKQFLNDSYVEANTTIYRKGHEEADLEGMGTTIVSCILFQDQMTVGHVGDSRGYRFRKGKLEPITRDHSLVQELIDEGKITPAEAHTHPNRNIITRALGVDANVKGDCDRIPLQPDDIILLCSDGLHGFAEEGPIRKAFEDFGQPGKVNLSQIAYRLIEVAKYFGGGDNISVALYHHRP